MIRGIKECISARYGRAGMGVPRCKKRATRNLFGPRCEKCYQRMVAAAKEDSVIRRVFSIRKRILQSA